MITPAQFRRAIKVVPGAPVYRPDREAMASVVVTAAVPYFSHEPGPRAKEFAVKEADRVLWRVLYGDLRDELYELHRHLSRDVYVERQGEHLKKIEAMLDKLKMP